MPTQESHNEKIIRLLKKDAEQKKYIRDYMREYRRKKKEETGIGQKQYYDLDDIKRRKREYYKIRTTLNDIKFLFF